MKNNSLQQYLRAHTGGGAIHIVGPLASPPLELMDPVIFVDGGAAYRQGDIGLVVGDGDSFDGPMDHGLSPDKDFSDLAFALSQVGPRFGVLHLHGFLGGRRDHEILNLGEVSHFLERRSEPAHILMDGNIEAFSAGEWQFHCRGLFTLLVFSPAQVTLSGDCRYTIPSGTEVRPVSSYGLSNQGHGAIQLTSDGPVFIFRDAGDGT